MNINAVDAKTSWNAASKSGLVLGGISSVYFIISMLMAKIDGGAAVSVLVNVLSVILWVLKFWLCIHLMKVFMQKFADANPEAGNNDTYRFGSRTALLSALIYSAVFLAWILFIQPDIYADAFNQAMEGYADVFTEAQMDAMDSMISKLPAISFFVNFFWCWLFGTVLAAIFSRNIPSRNPFAGSNADEQ